MRYSRNLTGVTIQVRVRDAKQGFAWYAKLLGRPADVEPDPGISEWELVPTCWLQVVKGEPIAGAGPIRLGVADIELERTYIQEQMEIQMTEVERLDDVVAWCNFTDPDGNPLGLYQDLTESGHLRD